MAKLAVIFFAAFAFQAAFAGVTRQYYNYQQQQQPQQQGLEDYSHEQFEGLIGQIHGVTHDLSVIFQDDLPVNEEVYKMLIWQHRELAQYIDEIINRFKVETIEYHGSIFEQIVSELRQIQVLLQQVQYVDVSNINQLKNQFYIYFQNVAKQIERLVLLVPTQTGAELTQAHTGTIYFVRQILKDFFAYAQYVHFQFQTVLQYGQTGQYHFGVEGTQGYQRFPGYQGQYYGYPKFGQYYYGGKYYGGRQMFQNPQQLFNEIEIMAKDLSMILQDTTFNGQQVAQVISMQARQFAQIIKNIIVELEGQATYYKVVDTTYQQVIDRLREVQLSLQKLAAYNTFTAVRQLKVQFDNYIQTVVAQIQKLYLVAQGETQGKLYITLQHVLYNFYDGFQTVYYQLRDLAQYQGHGYAYDKYDQGYGYDKYNQLYGKYDQGYGYGKYGKYDQVYGKYDQVYPKYDQVYGKYDQGYGYGKYGKYFQDKYNQLYGKYDQGYGYGKSDKYDQLYGKYDQVNGKYDQGYAYGKYGKYDQVYGKYDQGYGYGKSDKYDQLYGKYDQVYGKYDQGYGYGKYDQGYGYDKYNQLYGKYDQSKYDQGYGYGKYADQYKYGQYGPQTLDQYKYQNQYGNEYGLLNDQQYGYGLQGKYGYGLQGKYGYEMQGQTCEQLVNQIRLVAGKVTDELQALSTSDKVVKQAFVIQARQLVQIIDNMIVKLQAQITDEKVHQYEVIRQVIDNLRQIQVDLKTIATSGVITTVYQVKVQFVNYIENIVAELQKLVVVVDTDVQLTPIVKDVLMQYLEYLRNVYYQYQYKLKNIEARLQFVANKLQYRAEFLKNLFDTFTPQYYMQEKLQYIPFNQILNKLGQVAHAIQDDSDAGVAVYGVVVENNADETQH